MEITITTRDGPTLRLEKGPPCSGIQEGEESQPPIGYVLYPHPSHGAQDGFHFAIAQGLDSLVLELQVVARTEPGSPGTADAL